MASVKLDKAYKRFGEAEVIRGVDLDLPHGEFVVFVGPSGCGKSTLLRLIAGLEELSEGRLHIGEKDMTEVPAVDRGIAMVFQSYALYPHMSVRDNMGFGLRMNKMPKQQIAARVAKAADTLQLQSLLDRKPAALSGGQRQRVAIGRAIVREPDVFLFDEPLSNLDAELRVEMRLQIARLHNQLDATMIYVTHDQVEAMTMADRIVVLRAGKVEQVGSPLELYHHPDNQFVAGFIGSPKMNFVEATLITPGEQQSEVRIGSDGPSVLLPINSAGAVAGSPATLGLRPEDAGASDGEIVLSMQVDVAERLGGSTYLYGRAAGFDNFVVQRDGSDLADSGSQVDIHARADRAYLFDANGTAFRRLT